MLEDGGGGDGGETGESRRPAAGGFHARDAGDGSVLEHVFHLTVGAGAPRFSGAEDSHHRFAQGRRGMHRAGVIGDENRAEPEPLDQLREGGLTGEIHTTPGPGAGDGLREWDARDLRFP